MIPVWHESSDGIVDLAVYRATKDSDGGVLSAAGLESTLLTNGMFCRTNCFMIRQVASVVDGVSK